MTDDEPDAFEDDSGDPDEIDDPFARLDEDAPGDESGSDGPLFGEAKTENGDRGPAEAGADTGADDPFDELGPA
ncbi:hypothetical protein C468_05286, partial [Halorubrum kocurii JCM 14978]